MKQIKTFNKLAVFFFLVLFGCEKDDVLPDISSDGRDTFGMLVDGKVWQPYVPGLFSPPGHYPDISYYKKDSTLEISGSSDGMIYFTVTNINGTGEYVINRIFKTHIINPNINDSLNCFLRTRFVRKSDCFNSFQLIDSLKSEITITRFDTISFIVSGTFSMTLYNPDGKELKITKGRFDSHYKNFTK
ncbi:MAG: hypothetical protein HOO91_07740 [Bacteroidales bacterium]|nr:hypothetical protein [Bacteroidales bacterium]